jgi:hypothetical protein
MKGEPFECWYTSKEAAVRFGVTARAVAAAISADAELRAATVFLFNARRIPWSAWEAWIRRHPGFEFQPRVMPPRQVGARTVTEPARARSVGELRHKEACA